MMYQASAITQYHDTMSRFKKASIGWDHIIAMIIGLLVIIVLIFIAIKSKDKLAEIFSQIKQWFT